MILNCQEYMNWKEEDTYNNLMDLVADYKIKFNTKIKLITGRRDMYCNHAIIEFADETKLELDVHEYMSGDIKYRINLDYNGDKKDFIYLAELIDSYVDR